MKTMDFSGLCEAIRLELMFLHWIADVLPGSAGVDGARDAYRRSVEWRPRLH